MIKIKQNHKVIEVTSTFFPDGQPHVKLPKFSKEKVTVECRITNAEELFQLKLVEDILKEQYLTYTLRIMYLMGGRMDRRIDDTQPFTLKIVTDILNHPGQGRFRTVEIYDAHSEVSIDALHAKNILPYKQVKSVIDELGNNLVVVSPDAGAVHRTQLLAKGQKIVYCQKHRDSQTGRLSGFKITNPEIVKGKKCLIVDDILDGGGTFVGIASELRKAGAIEVNAFATHGIFSKGYDLKGIDNIWTTNTYRDVYPAHINMFKIW